MYAQLLGSAHVHMLVMCNPNYFFGGGLFYACDLFQKTMCVVMTTVMWMNGCLLN